MANRTKAVLAIALAMSLGGCQSLFGGTKFASRADSAEPATVDMSAYFAERIEAGKAHLRNNRPTQAIVAFRQASYDAAYSADAYNGMGVAYARMGRADLAKRFFGMALAAAPHDERYARNLARLESEGSANEIMLAATDNGDADPGAVIDETRDTSIAEAAGTGPLRRVSEREVEILSRADAAGAPMANRKLASAAVYPLRVELPPARIEKSAYPVRIAFSDVKSSVIPYPIRIELPKAR